MNNGYEVKLNITGQQCLIIGGGKIAARKAIDLRAVGAQVVVVSPKLGSELAELYRQGELQHIPRGYCPGDEQGYFMLICATDNPNVNAQAAESAKQHNILVSVADNPALGNTIRPAVINCGKLTLTVSSGGLSPRLSKLIGQDIKLQMRDLADFVDFVAEKRQELKAILPNSKDREGFWRQYLPDDTLAQLRAGQQKKLEGEISYAISCLRAKS